jgi:hypothetical protein
VAIAMYASGSGDPAPPKTTAVQPVANVAPMDQAMEEMLSGAPAGSGAKVTGTTKAVFLAAELNGNNEVPANDGKKVGDKDGRAIEVIRIQGGTVTFAVAWKGIAAPSASHVHEGAAGVNGAVKVPFFATALPAGVSAATGSVTVKDRAALDGLVNNPAGFYANLHTAEFPGGAVRGQFRKLDRPVDMERVLDFGSLASLGSGDQEIPAADGKATGDQDGRSAGFVWAKGDRVDFSLRWSGIGAPTLGHIHKGALGTNGAVVVPLFTAEGGLPASISGVAGSVTGLDPKLTATIAGDPGEFYTNLHTAEFPGGAVRGQLFRAGTEGQPAAENQQADTQQGETAPATDGGAMTGMGGMEHGGSGH